MSELFKDYPELISDLEEVKYYIEKHSRVYQKDFENTLVELFATKSKLLRPALVLICAGFNDYDKKNVYNLAAATEMLHVATLVHDDVIDDAKLRRGQQSVQDKYGKGFAVITGDYLFAKSFQIIFDSNIIENIREAGNTVVKLSLGESLQHFSRFNLNPNFKNYLRIISGKTAALFEMSCFLGAQAANLDVFTVKKLATIGDYIGKAFQIKDDILDFTNDEVNFGKPVLNDIQKGIYTLPLIYALEESIELRELLNNSHGNIDASEVIRLVKSTNGIKRASLLADRYINKSLKLTDSLKDCQSKEQLRYIISIVNNRSV